MARLQFALFSVFVFAAGLATSYFFLQAPDTSCGERQPDEEVHQGQMQFINPLLDCSSEYYKSAPKSLAIEEKVEKLINEIYAKGKATQISVYFRDLNNGPTFGIQEEIGFSPASLLKVPVMIGYFKNAEVEPKLLQRKLKVLEGDKIVEIVPVIQSQRPLAAGEVHTTEFLIEKMITESDNLAAITLLKDLKEHDPAKVLTDMGVRLGRDASGLVISVKNYATIFRILYNATYLNRTASTKALELLSKSTMRAALAAGVPEEIVVAHKFGERRLGETQQLHDCGIIYYPKRPYLLCVMTRTKAEATYDDISATIAAVSRVVYQEVSKQVK